MTCALCLEDKPTVNSHIIPKFAYRTIRKQDGRDPILVTGGKALLSSEQLTEHLLCSDCEQVFQKREDYVAKLIKPTAQEKPPIQKLARATKYETSQVRLLVLDDTIEIEKLIYFAVSLVWRGHIAKVTPECDLGEKYAEPIRRYLLGKSSVPNDVVVAANLFEGENGVISQILWPPFGVRHSGYHLHRCCVGGMEIRVGVGGKNPGFLRRLSLSKRLITSTTDFSQIPGAAKARRATVVGKLKALDRVRERG